MKDIVLPAETVITVDGKRLWVPYRSFTSQQREVMAVSKDVTQDICLFQGGFGGGKSFIVCLTLMRIAAKRHGASMFVVGESRPFLERTIVPIYREHLAAFGWVEGIHYEWRTKPLMLRFPQFNKSVQPALASRIEFIGYEETDKKLKGASIAAFHIEEASNCPEAVYLLLLSRLRQKGMDRYRGFLTTNPPPRLSWLNDHFIKNAGVSEILDPKTNKPTGRYQVVRRVLTKTADNMDNLPPGYEQLMKNAYDDEYYRINVLGEDADYTKGLVMKGWDELNESRCMAYTPSMRLYLSCDFNVDPMCWVIAHVVEGLDGKPIFHVFDELAMEGASTAEAAEAFALKYGGHPGGIVITGDASGDNRSVASLKVQDTNYTTMQNVLSRMGARNLLVDVPAVNPPRMQRVTTVNAAIKTGTGVRRLFISPDCKRLLYNVHELSFIDGTSDFRLPSRSAIEKDVSKKLKFLGHPYDALGYLICHYSPVERDAELRKGYNLQRVVWGAR